MEYQLCRERLDLVLIQGLAPLEVITLTRTCQKDDVERMISGKKIMPSKSELVLPLTLQCDDRRYILFN